MNSGIPTDSDEITSLVEEISIQPVDGPLAQSVDSLWSSVNRALTHAVSSTALMSDRSSMAKPGEKVSYVR